MKELQRVRDEISSILDEIERIPVEMRAALRQEEDAEAYEIVRRIERRLAGLPVLSPDEIHDVSK